MVFYQCIDFSFFCFCLNVSITHNLEWQWEKIMHDVLSAIDMFVFLLSALSVAGAAICHVLHGAAVCHFSDLRMVFHNAVSYLLDIRQ
jgi:hypothetical protein